MYDTYINADGSRGGTSYAQRAVVAALPTSEQGRNRGPAAWRVGTPARTGQGDGGTSSGGDRVVESVGLPGQCLEVFNSSAAIVRPCSQSAMRWTDGGATTPSMATITNAARTLCLTAPTPTPTPTPPLTWNGAGAGADASGAAVVAEGSAGEPSEPTGTLCIKHSHAPDDLWQPVCQPFAGVCINVNHTSTSEAGVHGYCFTVDRTSTWRLSYGLGVNTADCNTKRDGCEATLQSGKLRRGGGGDGGRGGGGVSEWVEPAEWHTLKLSKKGNVVTASVNGTEVVQYADRTVARVVRSGVVGIVSAAIPGISFDNFQIKRTEH